ncbi:MAG: 2'-deoxycytidine 5'-triphosphate deaminase [Bauldia sp.]|nr:2'-deoxycytidine 5'-triphosphate deaminase [Bauldia sp.]
MTVGLPQGILSDRSIAALWQAGVVTAPQPPDADQIQPASLDLRAGSVAIRVRASFLPGRAATVAERLADLRLHEIDLSQGAVLETGCVYIVPLLEALALPEGIAAAANPKSSTGRLDVFTRVITDRAQEFDTIPTGYNGPLYLEVSPRTFPIVIRTGSRLSQIRFRRGRARLDDDAHRALHAATPLVDGELHVDNGLVLSIDLDPPQGDILGYRAKRHTGVIDVDRRASYDMLDFWDPLAARGRPELILDPDQFYILVSREAVHVPPGYAAEMVPFDPLVGEFRVHYAGFFDPGFGNSGAGGAGSRAVLEVRSHEVPFVLEHGQIVCRLVYEKMATPPTVLYGAGIGSNYQAQGLKLSKHFR